MPLDLDLCIRKLEQAYHLLEDAKVDPKIQRALATSWFIYALQVGAVQEEKVREIVKGIIKPEEMVEIMEDRDYEAGDYYLLLPLSFTLRSLENNKSEALTQGINLLIDTANCLNDELIYDLHLTKTEPVKDDELFLKILKTFLQINQKLFTDEIADLTAEEIVEIVKILEIENSLTYVTVFNHALRIADSIQQDERIPSKEKANLFIMALKTLLFSEKDLKIAIVLVKKRHYDFAKDI
ncbi:MAG: hypothetical protein ACE5R6_09410 [Candidatus Heimdallarchaeota archaeon]